MPKNPTPPEAEATAADTVTVEYGGHDYTVPASVDDWPIDALEAAEKGSPTGVLGRVLGAEQYAAFKARNGKVRDLRAMSERIAEASGFNELGK